VNSWFPEIPREEGGTVKTIVSLTIGLALFGQSVAAWAEPRSTKSGAEQVAYGAGSVLGTLVYAPVKASFCILGAVSSGFAFPIAGPRTAGHIAGATCKGTWAITPDALKGKERVQFVGS
jgi:hypothetical protein